MPKKTAPNKATPKTPARTDRPTAPLASQDLRDRFDGAFNNPSQPMHVNLTKPSVKPHGGISPRPAPASGEGGNGGGGEG